MRAFVASVLFHLCILTADAQAQVTVQLKNTKWTAAIEVEYAIVAADAKCTGGTKASIANGAVVAITVPAGQRLCYRRDFDPGDAAAADWTCWRIIDFKDLATGELPLR